MNAIRYSTGTSWFTSSGSSFRKILPITRTRLSTAIANKIFTSSSRLTNRSISFIFGQTLAQNSNDSSPYPLLGRGGEAFRNRREWQFFSLLSLSQRERIEVRDFN